MCVCVHLYICICISNHLSSPPGAISFKHVLKVTVLTLIYRGDPETESNRGLPFVFRRHFVHARAQGN